MNKEPQSDGDTSTIRKALTEKTPVVMPLGVIIVFLIGLIVSTGSWALWMTVSIYELKLDMALVKAAVTHAEGLTIK